MRAPTAAASPGPASSAGPPASPPIQLRRAVGAVVATATSAGLAFAAIDYLGVVSILAFAPGAGGALCVLIGLAMVALVSGVFSELNGLYPTAAGIRLYLARAAGPRFAMSVTFTYMTTVVLVMAADAFLIGAALRHLLHAPAVVTYVLIVVLVGGAAGANLKGVRLAGWVQTLVTYTVLSGTALLSILALLHHGARLDSHLNPFGKGTVSGIQAIAFAIFLYAAFEWVSTTAEEAREVRVITRALFIAPLLICVVGTLFTLALAHLVPFDSAHHSAYPQLLLGKAALGEFGEIWMLALTVLTALNTFNGGFLVASRFIYAAAREHTLPRRFAALNVNAVPWFAVVTLAVAASVVAAIVFATGQWLLLVSVGAAIESAIYALGSLSLFILRRRETRERPYTLAAGRPLALVGTIVFSGLFLATGLADPKHPSKFSIVPLAIIAILTLASALYVRIVVPRLQAAAAARAAANRPRRRPTRTA